MSPVAHASVWWAAMMALLLVLIGIAALAMLDALLRARLAHQPWRGGVLTRPFRQAFRSIFKEFRPTEHPDLALWLAAPVLLLSAVMAALAVMPLSPDWIGADLRVGIVFFTAQFALVSAAVYLAGWGPNSKYPLIAGYRFIGLMLAYEMPWAITIIAVALPASSLQLGAIVAAQGHLWNVILQPLGFVLYLICALGIAFWGPLNLVTSSDLAGGVKAELSGAPLLVWRLGHYGLLLAVSAFAVPLFLGGAAGPWLPGPLWTVLKTLLIATLLLWISHRLPHIELEQFMKWAWILLIPLALLNIFLVGGMLLLWPGLRGVAS